MTYETLIKFKEIYENKGDTKQLAKVLKNLERYEKKEQAKDSEPKEVKKKGGK